MAATPRTNDDTPPAGTPGGLFLGLISGTSVDGIDAALVAFEPAPRIAFGRTYPYPADLHADVLRWSQAQADEFMLSVWQPDEHPPWPRWLEQLPVGTARRTIALRLRFKAARQARNTRVALDAARVLTKHRAFSEVAGAGIVRGLALEMLRNAHDAAQLSQAWASLELSERQQPDVALEAAQRLLSVQGDPAVARLWVLPLWESQGHSLTTDQRVRLTGILETSFGASEALPDAAWLARIEQAQMALPGDPLLQYLAGVMCVRLSLWGKAQALLKQSIPLLKDAGLKRRALLALADLAEHRMDTKAAAEAYKAAARA